MLDSDAPGGDPTAALEPGGYELSAILPYAVVRTGAALEKTFARAMSSIGLTPRQFGILFQFAGGQTSTAAAIARQLGVSPQGIAGQIDTLHARRLIDRTPRPGQGRPNELRLTTAGERVLAQALQLARAEQARVVQDLSAAEQRTLLAQLRRLAARAADGTAET